MKQPSSSSKLARYSFIAAVIIGSIAPVMQYIFHR